MKLKMLAMFGAMLLVPLVTIASWPSTARSGQAVPEQSPGQGGSFGTGTGGITGTGGVTGTGGITGEAGTTGTGGTEGAPTGTAGTTGGTEGVPTGTAGTTGGGGTVGSFGTYSGPTS
jgi:hypothetical protein